MKDFLGKITKKTGFLSFMSDYLSEIHYFRHDTYWHIHDVEKNDNVAFFRFFCFSVSLSFLLGSDFLAKNPYYLYYLYFRS